jgi:hypothetical protein
MDDVLTSKELGIAVRRTVIKKMSRDEFMKVKLLPEIIKTQSWHLLDAEGATHVEIDQNTKEIIFVKYEAVEEERDVPVDELGAAEQNEDGSESSETD